MSKFIKKPYVAPNPETLKKNVNNIFKDVTDLDGTFRDPKDLKPKLCHICQLPGRFVDRYGKVWCYNDFIIQAGVTKIPAKKQLYKQHRNEQCFCKSGKKAKDCHGKLY